MAVVEIAGPRLHATPPRTEGSSKHPPLCCRGRKLVIRRVC